MLVFAFGRIYGLKRDDYREVACTIAQQRCKGWPDGTWLASRIRRGVRGGAQARPSDVSYLLSNGHWSSVAWWHDDLHGYFTSVRELRRAMRLAERSPFLPLPDPSTVSDTVRRITHEIRMLEAVGNLIGEPDESVDFNSGPLGTSWLSPAFKNRS